MMEKVVIHLEWDNDQTHRVSGRHASLGSMLDTLDCKFKAIRGTIGEDIGWRYFASLEEAILWEQGDCDHGYGHGSWPHD